jgi:hypothetical protein
VINKEKLIRKRHIHHSFNPIRNDVVMKQSDNTLDTTVDEWQAEMGRLQPGAPGETVMELRKKFGDIPKSTMQSRLDRLVESGRCIRRLGTRVSVSGASYVVSVYQLKKEKK